MKKNSVVIGIVFSFVVHLGLFILVLPKWNQSSIVIPVRVEYLGSSFDKKTLTNSGQNQLKKNKKQLSKKTISSTLQTPKGSVDRAGGHNLVLGSELGIHATYPRLSRLLGEEGIVKIALKKKLNGVYNVQIVDPSIGFKRLNQSALLATKTSYQSNLFKKFLNGEEEVILTFVFKLKK